MASPLLEHLALPTLFYGYLTFYVLEQLESLLLGECVTSSLLEQLLPLLLPIAINLLEQLVLLLLVECVAGRSYCLLLRMRREIPPVPYTRD
jgi:hypothetical protein